MGKIRNLQLDYLEGGSEMIDFKVFDSDGTYVETLNEDVLYKAPFDLTPLNMDLIKEYERPLQKVIFETSLLNISIKNRNAHFLHGDDYFIIQTPDSGTTSAIISDENEPIKALSGNKFFKSTNQTLDTGAIAMLTIDRNDYTFPQGKPMKVSFNYYLATTDESDKYELSLKAGLQETYSVGSGYLKEYDFENDNWINYNGSTNNMKTKTIETTTVNSWGKFTANIDPYLSSSSDDDVFIDITIVKPKNVPSASNSDFSAIYIDNFFIAETVDFSDNKMTAIRKQIPNNGTFSAKLEVKDNILSNEAESADYFIGRIEGDFKRQRDTVGKKLEQCITAEMLNDYRYHLNRYEGTFRDGKIEPMGFHNKIHIDFGDQVFQEEASCYIDSMKYDVKAAEYDITMHVPNQDDDVRSTYKTLFE